MELLKGDNNVNGDGKKFNAIKVTKKDTFLFIISRRIVAKMMFQAPIQTRQD